MRAIRFFSGTLIALLAVVLIASGPAGAQTYSVLHALSGADGSQPLDGLAMDRGGNLYGTTSQGGSTGHGTVFKLSNRNGSWILSVLYSFRGGNDGDHPYAGVTIGADGAVYGTTSTGAVGGSGCAPGGCGTVYKLTPPARLCGSINCPWTETIIYKFANNQEHLHAPYGRVIFDAAGNLYGTTAGGGGGNCSSGCGGVYKLTHSGGSWAGSTLYTFAGTTDGAYPECTLAMDPAGNLYGTTFGFSDHGYGTVFELIPSGGGWSERTLYTFLGTTDGGWSTAGVVLDAAGNLYGTTTLYDGNPLAGVAFEVSPTGGGNWTYSVIQVFGGSLTNGLAFDTTGSLYGTTLFGGANDWGEVFKLTKAGSTWTPTDLYDFSNQGSGGYFPESTVIFDAAGNLYGTTNGGGSGNSGVIWKIVP